MKFVSPVFYWIFGAVCGAAALVGASHFPAVFAKPEPAEWIFEEGRACSIISNGWPDSFGISLSWGETGDFQFDFSAPREGTEWFWENLSAYMDDEPIYLGPYDSGGASSLYHRFYRYYKSGEPMNLLYQIGLSETLSLRLPGYEEPLAEWSTSGFEEALEQVQGCLDRKRSEGA